MEDKQAALIVKLHASKQLLVYLVLLYWIMAFNIIAMLPWLLAALSLLILAGHVVWLVKRYGYLSAAPLIERVDLNRSGDVAVYYQQGQKHNYSLVQSYTCNWFVILSLASSQSWLKKRVFICHDAVSKEDFRRLNVYLNEPKLYQR